MQKARSHPAFAELLPPVGQLVSGSISLRSPRFFSIFPHGTCPLSVACEYLALGDGSPKFSSGSTYRGILGDINREAPNPFAYRTITFLGRPFQAFWLKFGEISSRRVLGSQPSMPHDPRKATPQGLTPSRFGLFRFRSPLLTESNFFLLLGLLRCFTSPRLASFSYEFRKGSPEDSGEVAPFGDPRIKACLRLPEAYRSLPRPSSPPSAKSSTNGP